MFENMKGSNFDLSGKLQSKEYLLFREKEAKSF